jgi:hypothetical protein
MDSELDPPGFGFPPAPQKLPLEALKSPKEAVKNPIERLEISWD